MEGRFTSFNFDSEVFKKNHEIRGHAPPLSETLCPLLIYVNLSEIHASKYIYKKFSKSVIDIIL